MVGSYPIEPGTLSAGTNYTLTFVSTNLTITARPITVSADAGSKTYGEADPGLTWQITSGSLVSGDNLSGSLTRVPGEHAGLYEIQQGSLLATTNYTFVPANLTIGQRPLLAQADNQSRLYGATNPVFTISYSGFIGTDSVTNLAVLPQASTLTDPNSPIGA